MTARLEPGDRAVLAGAFLACTGQRLGDVGARVWTVQACACGLCEGGRFVAVDEEALFGGQRHVARANLARFGESSKSHEAPQIGRRYP